MLIIISSTFLFLFLLIKLYSYSSETKNSPPRLPLIGNLHQIGSFPHRNFYALAKKYGPFMQMYFGKVPILVISSAEAARDITKTHDHVFANRPPKINYDILLYNFRDVSSAPYGEYWRQLRSICMLHLLSAKRVKSLRAVREEELVLMMDKIRDYSSKSLPVNLSELIASKTNDVVCRATLGNKYSGESGTGFAKLMMDFTELLGTFMVGDYVPSLDWMTHLSGYYSRAKKVAKQFDDLLEGVVEERFNNPKGDDEEQTDLVDVLLWIQRIESLGFPIDRTTIKALLLDMFVAGTDTISTLLEWEMSELLKNPHMMKRLKEEARTVANGRTYITEDDLSNMKYLKAVAKEALRMYPPIPLLVPRECRQDVKVNGYNIKAGTRVFINAWGIARDPRYWDQPDEFRPERFLDTSVDVKGIDYQLIPFGSGRRGCPGLVYAMAANDLVLANLVHQFNWELPGGAGAKVDMSEAFGFTVHRKFPLMAYAAVSNQN
ncbi:cytochrome P450 736A117-like [Vicia villosa]|uniref:cytochrome P450 736A117-like n=1 Tax=Vicia villosa TaxID=3911 RepID=UPI00273B696F|nr:cytochrome P450 736A117-like [Vicia villosa]XP_058763265.1 cytochrome P450 736A117-like [Vicia villosa]